MAELGSVCTETLVEFDSKVRWYCTLHEGHGGDHEAHVKLDNSDEPRRTWPSAVMTIPAVGDQP